MRQNPLIIANWKMYKTAEEAASFASTLPALIDESQARVGIAAPFTYLESLANLLEQSKASLMLGAQNLHEAEEGAFTGEISARMLRSVGVRFVIVGHSERRHLFKEGDDRINLKVKRALSSGLEVIFCVGETLEEREGGLEKKVLERQLYPGLAGVETLDRVAIAYEPVWAIGTGRVAKPEDAQAIHAYCRLLVRDKWGGESAERLTLQYGGSVKPENAKKLLQQPDIDGLLVGGASLDVESFSSIINAKEEL